MVTKNGDLFPGRNPELLLSVNFPVHHSANQSLAIFKLEVEIHTQPVLMEQRRVWRRRLSLNGKKNHRTVNSIILYEFYFIIM